jgi:DNA-binding NarL/FixJ family response regulator
LKKINIIVIDPSPIIQIGFKTLFKNSSKFELIECFNTIYDFKEFIKSNNVDIIITELKLSDGDAYDIIKSIRLIKKEIPVLIFTSKPQKLHAIGILKSGAVGYLSKNSKKRQIKDTLEKIALQNFSFIETNSFTRLKNNFNEDYNKIKMDSLSKREIQVLKLFIKGEKNVQISNKLNINQKTVNTYQGRIMKKLGVDSKVELFMMGKSYLIQPY